MSKDQLKPIIVLVCICFVATLALAVIHNITQPIIDANQAKADNEARMAVLPEGDSFTEADVDLVEGVDSCFVADNGAGIAVTSEYKGFGGAVISIVGVDSEGTITGVQVTDYSNETPGLGTRAAEPEYLEQYVGKSGLSAGHINDDDQVDAISGATITSNAVYNDVVEALKQFEAMGGSTSGSDTDSEAADSAQPDSSDQAAGTEDNGGAE